MTNDERVWRRRAAAVSTLVNLGFVAELWLRIAAGLTLLSAVAVLLGRFLGLPANRFLCGWGAVLAIAIIAAAALRRRSFWCVDDGLLRLEIAGRLHGGLSVALVGVSLWPEAGGDRDAAFRWNVKRAGAPFLFSCVLLLVSVWVPITPQQFQTNSTPGVQPGSWRQVEDWIKQLRNADVARPEALNRVEQQLRSLQQQPPAQWYSHASLEAGASLKARTEEALRAMGQELAKTKATADAARRSGLSSPQEGKAASASAAQSVSALEAGLLPPGNSMSNALKRLAQSGDLRSIDAKTLSDISDTLKRGIEGVEKCLGRGSCKLKPGPGEDGPGRGGIDRGPGEAPLTIGRSSPPVAGKQEGMESDLRNASVGDVIKTQVSAPEVEPADSTGAAGEISGIGQGGDAVARQELLPAEQEILKKYFR